MIIYIIGALITLVVLGFCYGKFDWYENFGYMPRVILLIPTVLWPIALPLILLFLLLNYFIKLGEKHQ